MSVSGPNFVTDPKKELGKMDQTVHMTNYRRHDSCTFNSMYSTVHLLLET